MGLQAIAPLALLAFLAGEAPLQRGGSTVDNDLKIALDHGAPAADRTRAIRRLADARAEAAVAPLIFELQRVDGPLKDELRRALGQLGATQILARELAAEDPKLRARAAELLPFVPGPEGLEPLLVATADPVAKVRELAAAALWRFAAPGTEAPRGGGDRRPRGERPVEPRALAALVPLLTGDPDPDVRSAAAQSLGHLGGAEARRALEAALDTERDGFVRVLLEEALKRARAGG